MQVRADRHGGLAPGPPDPKEEDRGQDQAEGAARGESCLLRTDQPEAHLQVVAGKKQENESLAHYILHFYPLHIYIHTLPERPSPSFILKAFSGYLLLAPSL